MWTIFPTYVYVLLYYCTYGAQVHHGLLVFLAGLICGLQRRYTISTAIILSFFFPLKKRKNKKKKKVTVGSLTENVITRSAEYNNKMSSM